MPGAPLRQRTRLPRTPSPLETALYTYDMLKSLKRLAELNKQARLAYLIEAAAAEAQSAVEAHKTGEE